MIRYYKTIENKLEKLNSFEEGCWINLVEPNQSEINEIANLLNIDIDSIKSALDEEERSRIDVEDNHTLILIDIPVDESDDKSSHYTYKKTRFILQILHKNATYYLHYLRRINKMTTIIEKEIYNSMKNKQLIQLLELEKSLVYFSTSLKANELVLNKMIRTSSIKKYSEDEDLLEDVLVENRQAVEMATIYGDILSRIMDAFSAIISNNQNGVMQFLTSVTLITTIPTIISGFFGMNVGGIPYANDVNGFWIVMLITTLICLVITFFMSRNKLL